MAIIKCKMCGGDLLLTEGSTIATCEYCGTTQTVPSQDNEKKLAQFARANQHRSECEFDKAAGVYESIIADFPGEAEAYWGLVLCKYGIEYVDDPATGKKIPTCHRSSFDAVMDDKDFEQVMDTADVTARKVYREEARQIEQIRKAIVEVSAKEDPYDIFICYKETDESGERTVDSVLAQNLYNALTEKGYRVFFSRISLEDKLGQAYEPYIFAALNSAKVMLAIGTDYEHFNAVWVKNEWSRYLKLIAKGEKKTLIPCYKGIDAYDMPKEFRALQAQDLGKVGAEQDLLRGLDKILTAKEKKEKTVVSEGMTKEEKHMVDTMRRNQKRILASILSIVIGVVFVFLSILLMELAPDSYFDILGYKQGRAITWTGDPRVMLLMVEFGIIGIGVGLFVTYGLKGRGAHWVFLIMSAWSAAQIYFVSNWGLVPAGSLSVYLAACALMAAITALGAYHKKKIALIIHLLIIAALMVFAAMFGGFRF